MKVFGRLFSGTFGLTLALDLWTKALVQARFQLFETLPLLPGLALTYVRNKGAAFSLLASAPQSLRLPFFLLITVAAVVAIIHFLRQTPLSDRVTRLALGLVAGGAIGNAIDRARYGEVVDFIEVGVRSVYTWPIFNVADSAVCIGVGLLLWRAYKPFPESSQA
jgi:signal peptidase II